MKQVDVIKSILTAYTESGGDPNNIPLAMAYVEAHKPAGVGRVTEVILRAILKGVPQSTAPKNRAPISAGITENVTVTVNMPPDVMPEATRKNVPYPVPVVEKPIVIAMKTVTLPEVMKDRPVAIYRETPPVPASEPPVPVSEAVLPDPAPVVPVSEPPAPVTHVNAPPLPNEPIEPPKKKKRSLFQRLRDAIDQLAGD